MSMTLYGFPLSANTHRVRLLLSMLDLQWSECVVNLVSGEHRRPEFLALNPLGQVPVLQDGDAILRDSHAILYYLARKYDPEHAWLAQDAWAASRVMQWLFMDANDLHNGLGYARNHVTFGIRCDLELAQSRALAALQVLERSLAEDH